MTYIASYHGFTVDGNTPTTSDEVYIDPGLTKTIKFKYRNDGTDTWSKTGSNPVRLGTASPQNRASGFADNGSGGLNTGWLSISGYPKSRIEMVESSVTPGNYAHFEAVFKGMPENQPKTSHKIDLSECCGFQSVTTTDGKKTLSVCPKCGEPCKTKKGEYTKKHLAKGVL